MRFVVYGAGAIGGAIGGRLFQAGHDVTLVARGDHLRGAPGARAHAGVARPARPRCPSPRWATRRGRPARRRRRGPGHEEPAHRGRRWPTWRRWRRPASRSPCAQNGVENERLALRFVPRRLRGSRSCCRRPTSSPASSTPGRRRSPACSTSGGYPGRASTPRPRPSPPRCRGATFDSEARPDIMRWKYRKLRPQPGQRGRGACAGPDRPVVGPLVRLAAEEGEAALDAAGIDGASADEDQARRGDLLRCARSTAIGGRAARRGRAWPGAPAPSRPTT